MFEKFQKIEKSRNLRADDEKILNERMQILKTRFNAHVDDRHDYDAKNKTHFLFSSNSYDFLNAATKNVRHRRKFLD